MCAFDAPMSRKSRTLRGHSGTLAPASDLTVWPGYALRRMRLAGWFRRHRWLLSERPEIDAQGDKETLRKEYGEGAVPRRWTPQGPRSDRPVIEAPLDEEGRREE